MSSAITYCGSDIQTNFSKRENLKLALMGKATDVKWVWGFWGLPTPLVRLFSIFSKGLFISTNRFQLFLYPYGMFWQSLLSFVTSSKTVALPLFWIVLNSKPCKKYCNAAETQGKDFIDLYLCTTVGDFF